MRGEEHYWGKLLIELNFHDWFLYKQVWEKLCVSESIQNSCWQELICFMSKVGYVRKA